MCKIKIQFSILGDIKKFLLTKLFKLPINSVIIIQQGGLGNQLFQYFLGQELEKIYHKNVYFYDLRNKYKIRHSTDLENIFDLHLEKYTFSSYNLFLKIILSAKFLKFNKFIYRKFQLKFLLNLYFDIPERPIKLSNLSHTKNILIFFGTWQNLINKYKNNSHSIDLTFNKNIFLPNLFDFEKKFISLHVRRGDYCNPKTSNFHGNLDISYYLNGINFLRNKFGNIPVLLFSDDYEWIKENLFFKIPNSYVISSPRLTSEIDFYIMTKAKYFILSNSTFSWLSAYLSERKDKFVILPKFWFKNRIITNDYIYKDWKYKVIE